MDLTGINLRGSSLVYTNLNGATLDFAVMRQVYALNANLQDASFNRTDLSNANLQGANIANSWFSAADLSWTYQWTTNMTGATFHNADMTRSGLSQVNAEGADFSRAKIDYVRWFGNFNNTIFDRTHLISSQLGGDFQNSSFWEAHLSESVCDYFYVCNFSHSVFINANFYKFNFGSANLNDTNFNGADFSFASFNNAHFISDNGTLLTNFSNSYWFQTSWLDGTLCDDVPPYWTIPSDYTCA